MRKIFLRWLMGIIVSVVQFSPTAMAEPCGNVGYTGCCIDDTHAQYCKNGSLVIKDCLADPKYKQCGWYAAKGFYTCTDNLNSDPIGKYPRRCSDLPPGGIPDPDAGIKADKSLTNPCGTLTSIGCCDGETLKFCSDGVIKTKGCGIQPKCGWDNAKNTYRCGTLGAADPAGQNPMKCSDFIIPAGKMDSIDTEKANTQVTDGKGCSIGSAQDLSSALTLILCAVFFSLFYLFRRGH